MSGFASKWMLYNAALEAGQVVPALIAWLVSLVTVFYMLKASAAVFLGPESEAASRAHGESRSMLWGMGLLAGASVLLGIFPQLAMQVLINPILPAVGSAQVAGVSWLGLSTGMGSWQTIGGLALALLAVGGGLLIYFLARPGVQLAVETGTASIGGGTFTGGEPLSGSGSLPASDFSAVMASAWAPLYPWMDVDRLYQALWRLLLAGSRRLQGAFVWMEGHLLLLLASLVVILVAALGLSSAGQTGTGIVEAASPAGVLVITCGTALLILTLAAGTAVTRSSLPLMLIAGFLAVAGLWADGWLRLALVELGALLASIVVWRTSTERRAAVVYLVVVLASAVLQIAGKALTDAGQPGWAQALTAAGLLLKLGLVPFFFWLPLVCAAVPAVIAGLLVAVIDLTAFGELWELRYAAPGLFAPGGWLQVLALLSALLGAILMLAQTDLKRLLAFSTVEDLGYLLFGLTTAGAWGLQGALLGVGVHALAKATLFATLAAPEADGPLTFIRRGLAARYPFSAAVFLIGSLAMLGVPLTVGFMARWRLYGSALESGPFFLGLLMLSTGLALLAYTRAIRWVWWGPSPEDPASPQSTAKTRLEPGLLRLGLALAGLALLTAGLWPGLLPALSAWIGG
jgi:formate hydrogenlyase subunit 3/multisubunit Na+/H+ antiporter MnhD subunit